ncbi:MAG: hypothetical protein FJ303_17385 [Planctomycetes bacterium]|nr:hypothetical protein [Planctomycetota bacterium]
MRRPFVVSLFTFLLTVPVLVGCADSMAEVSGTVKYDGKLVDDGTIRFEDATGAAPTAGGPIKNGVYSVRVHRGDMKVTISASKTISKKKLYETKDDYMELTGEALPERYSDVQKTELRFEVKPGANAKDWDLAK